MGVMDRDTREKRLYLAFRAHTAPFKGPFLIYPRKLNPRNRKVLIVRNKFKIQC